MKLWYDSRSDGDSEEEPWKKCGSIWNAFEGWRVAVDEDYTAMSFAVDQVGLRNCLRQIVNDLNGIESYKRKFNQLWSQHIQPLINQITSTCSNVSCDIVNASLLLVATSSFLCDLSTLEDIVEWFDEIYGENDERNEVRAYIVQEMRQVIQKFDTLAIRLSLRYFSIPELKSDNESLSPRAGSHWVYSILRSASLYWPSENDSNKSTNRGQSSFMDSHSHESSSIFWSHG